MTDHQNGHHAAPLAADDIELHIERLLYGDLRRFRKAVGTPEFQDLFDEFLDRVVEGGIDNVPLIYVNRLSERLTALIEDAMAGKARPVELSTPGFDGA